jgi:hypothetical protein
MCALAGLLTTVACDRDNEPARSAHNERHEPRDGALMPPNNMTPASRTRSAAEQLAEARCQRENQCGNIGADKTYSSKQDCLARIQSDWKEDLNARACPGGINQHELNECLEQVRSEACANPFDTLARVTECTSRQICIEQP